MLARCLTYVLDGITAHPVTVECDVRPGLPSFTVVGLPDTAARELRETVRPAIQNAGYAFPQGRVSVNIAPARLRRNAPTLPLAVALAVLAAGGEIPVGQLADVAVYGSLGLGGELAALPGTLAAVAAHQTTGQPGLLLYAGLAAAQLPAAPRARAVSHLTSIVSPAAAAPAPPGASGRAPGGWTADFADIRGHAEAIFALTVAAAGGHHILLRGGRGSGATMLARRLVTILPDLTAEQEWAVATIHDAAGLHHRPHRPFRAPHHTISATGLVGGGAPVRPGEASLAHHGVLYLADLPEFQRSTLEALRAPLDEQSITIVRGERAYRFPASFQLIASAAPCPCGHANTDRCVCTSADLLRHHHRLSASLLDRFPIVVDLPADVDLQDAVPAPRSADLRDRVLAARQRTASHHAPAVSSAAEAALTTAYQVGSIGARSGAAVLDVAKTLAALAGEDTVTAEAVNHALALSARPAAPTSHLAC